MAPEEMEVPPLTWARTAQHWVPLFRIPVYRKHQNTSHFPLGPKEIFLQVIDQLSKWEYRKTTRPPRPEEAENTQGVQGEGARGKGCFCPKLATQITQIGV